MINILVNQNITRLKESATLAINLKVKEMRAKGEEVYHFGFGESPFAVHPQVQKALKDNSHRKEYLSTLGLPELRSAIATFYKNHFDYNFDMDEILIGPGSKELIFQVLFILEGPVIIPAPSWVSYGPQVNVRGKYILPIMTKRKNKYKITAEELDERCQFLLDEQKILILNNPSNPTGALYNDDEVKALAKICKKHNIIVISDEIYALIKYSKEKYAGFHQYYPEGTITTAGLSKSHSAGGYRLGFIHIPDTMNEVMKCLKAMVSETFSAVSSPIQYAAVEAYSEQSGQIEYVAECTKIHKACGYYLQKRFKKMGLGCPKPEGAFYLFPDFNNFKEKFENVGVHNSLDLSFHLLEKTKVAMLAGSHFYCPTSFLGLRVATVDYNGPEVHKASLTYKKELDDEFVETNCSNLKKACDSIEAYLATL